MLLSMQTARLKCLFYIKFMSNVFSIREIEQLYDNLGNINEICFYDENNVRRCHKINSRTDTDFFVNQKGIHNKYYEMYSAFSDAKTKFYLVVRYGRIGRKATEDLYAFDSVNELSDFKQKKKYEKLQKGYDHIDSLEEYKRIAGGMHNE